MRIALILCGSLLAACADDERVAGDQAASGTHDAASPSDSKTPTLIVNFIYEPAACEDHSVRLMGSVFDESQNLVDAICRYTFGDGTTADGCTVVHSVPAPSNVVLTALDPSTGATGRSEQIVSGPESFSATLDVTAAGLAISWNAHTLYGQSPDVGSVHITVEPADQVIVTDPTVFSQFTGTVAVARAGTYTVTLGATISFGEVGGCSAQAEQTVDVTCDATGSPH